MQEPYARAALPPRASLERQWHKVVSPRGKVPLMVGLLGKNLEEFWIHFDVDVKRTVPCRGEERCSYCKATLPRRYRAFCAAMDSQTRDLCVVEITEGAARTILSDPLAANGLRGLLLCLRRFKVHANAPVHATLTEGRTTSAKIPPAFDVMPSLQRLWDNCSATRKEKLSADKLLAELAEGEIRQPSSYSDDDPDVHGA